MADSEQEGARLAALLGNKSRLMMGNHGVLVIANTVGRKLAVMRGDREQLIQRLASLTTIGKSISLSHTADDLLGTIYTECGKVIDVSIFSIALVDTATNELSFELNVDRGERMPKSRLPVGEGLNAWVVSNGRPLLMGTSRDEERYGVVSFDDGISTESWLGVPMVARSPRRGCPLGARVRGERAPRRRHRLVGRDGRGVHARARAHE